MTVLHFKKKMDCKNATKCFNNFWENYLTLHPSARLGIEMHVTIYHSLPHHLIWLSYYTDGKHENWVRDEKFEEGKVSTHFHIVKTPFNKSQKRFKGEIPKIKDIQKL